MTGRWLPGCAVLAMLLFAAGGRALAGAPRQPERAALAGRWVLDDEHVSILPPKKREPGFGGGGLPGGYFGGVNGRRLPRESGRADTTRARRPPRDLPSIPRSPLPVQMDVSETEREVTIADVSGRIVQCILLRSGQEAARPPGADTLVGAWAKDRLEARGAREGRSTLQTISLGRRGEVLTIRTRVEATDHAPGADIKRAYRRPGS